MRHSEPGTARRSGRVASMSSSVPPKKPSAASNWVPNATSGAATMSAASTPQSNAPAWSANMTTFPANGNAGAGPSFPQFSASTAAILERLQGRASGPASGSAAFEAKKAELLQNYVTSDKLPTPPPIAAGSRRGRGAKAGTPNRVKVEGASPTVASSGRGAGRGRGRGRGGRGGRGGKRKRKDSDEDEQVSAWSLSRQQPVDMTRTTTTRTSRTHTLRCPHAPSPAEV